MIVLLSEKLGSAYTVGPVDKELYYSSLYKDGSYSGNFNDYIEVDWMQCLGEDEWITDELNRIHDLLLAEI